MDEESFKDNSEEFNIITLGNPGVGKTSIIQRFVCDDFNPDQLSTLGISHSFRDLEIENKIIKLKLIDTGGQEKYRSLSFNYFKNADVVLFVFDLNLAESFDSIQYWVDLFNENNSGNNLKLKYLIGNKNDLEQKVCQALIDELVNKNGLLYLSTSARTKSQIDEMFEYIAGELYEFTKKQNKNKTGGPSQKGKILTKTAVKNQQNQPQCCH